MPMGNGLHPVADEVLYREEYAEPVLVFVDPEEPDIEIVLVTNEGVSLEWIPQTTVRNSHHADR